VGEARRIPALIARRQAVAIAGHRGDVGTVRAALDDPEGSVRATAYGALARAGVLGDDDLERAVQDPDPAVRRRAAEATAAAPPPQATRFLLILLDDDESMVVEVAAWACGEVVAAEGEEQAAEGDRAAVVERLATLVHDHGDPLVREAAVAALGSIGDRAGLEAILAATSDKPAVRRRAVLALAPFEGAEVDAALTRALSDRDWQVRQAAEVLTSNED
jgi:HEAT repeat protein